MACNKTAVKWLTAFTLSSKKSARTFVDKRDFYSLSYRYKGEIYVEDNGEKLFSKEDSITFIPKGLSYNTEILDEMSMAVIHFKLDSDIDFRNAAVIDSQDARIKHLFDTLVRICRSSEEIDFRAMSVFYELLSRLAEMSEKEIWGKIPIKIREARKFIEENYSDPSVYVESISDRLGISTSYLRREFSRAYGKSPVNFLIDTRVKNAKNMLESGYLSVSEIAEQCGFSSASYFIQTFNRLVGESPDRYRKRVKI